jgi:hypothetical protein
MGDLKSEINTACARFQDQFNGVLEIARMEDKATGLSTFLKAYIFLIPHKPKWALFPLYVIYELLYRYSRRDGVSAQDISSAYTLVTLQLYHAMQELNGPAKIDLHMVRSFNAKTLRSGRAHDEIDEYNDFKRKGIILNPIMNGSRTMYTFDHFLLDIIGQGPLTELPSGGKSRRRRQHRRFRSKKRGRKSLRKRRN